MIIAQGGDPNVIENPQLMKEAPIIKRVYAADGEAGFMSGFDALEVGETVRELGGGRAKKGDAIDHTVGLKIKAKVGMEVKPGDLLFEIHAKNRKDFRKAETRLREALEFSPTPVSPPELLHEVIK